MKKYKIEFKSSSFNERKKIIVHGTEHFITDQMTFVIRNDKDDVLLCDFKNVDSVEITNG